jgi:hypothetical protein
MRGPAQASVPTVAEWGKGGLRIMAETLLEMRLSCCLRLRAGRSYTRDITFSPGPGSRAGTGGRLGRGRSGHARAPRAGTKSTIVPIAASSYWPFKTDGTGELFDIGEVSETNGNAQPEIYEEEPEEEEEEAEPA